MVRRKNKRVEGDGKGYITIKMKGHPNAAVNGLIRKHTLVAEKALGKPMPPGVIVHHVDEDRSKNSPSNLVVCENNTYHLFLHRRMKALKVCGYANWRKCRFCKKYDDPENMCIYLPRNAAWHTKCQNEYQNQRRNNS